MFNSFTCKGCKYLQTKGKKKFCTESGDAVSIVS